MVAFQYTSKIEFFLYLKHKKDANFEMKSLLILKKNIFQ